MMYVRFVTLKYMSPLRKAITCNRCGASMSASIEEIDENSEVALQDYILEKWNRRANDDRA